MSDPCDIACLDCFAAGGGGSDHSNHIEREQEFMIERREEIGKISELLLSFERALDNHNRVVGMVGHVMMDEIGLKLSYNINRVDKEWWATHWGHRLVSGKRHEVYWAIAKEKKRLLYILTSDEQRALEDAERWPEDVPVPCDSFVGTPEEDVLALNRELKRRLELAEKERDEYKRCFIQQLYESVGK